MKNWLAAFLVSVLMLGVAETASAELGGQVFFRGGVARQTERSRSGEILTDTAGVGPVLGGGGLNDDRLGYSLGFGLDVPLFKDPWFKGTVLGEVLIDYAQISRKSVPQALTAVATDTLLGTAVLVPSKLTVSQLVIVGAPKYRAEFGRIRPWLIPVGMAFIVNNPPSDDVTVLQPGLHFGAGVDYRLLGPISVGVDFRYNLEFNAVSNIQGGDFFTAGGYLGFNF